MCPTRAPIVACPVCHQTDQVKLMQTAYKEGEISIAPPLMPESHASLVTYISAGAVLVGVAVFLSIVILATNVFSWLQMILTLACIAAALVLSFLGIRHVSRSDEEARRRYPLWDQAMATWACLRFCARDQVVFDQEHSQVLDGAAVAALLDLDHQAELHPSTHTARIVQLADLS